MQEVVIVSACRTAIGTFGGTLRDVNGAFLGSVTMGEAVRRAGIDPEIIDDVRYGCCMEHHNTLNVTRVAALMAGIPESVPAATVNRVCISGMEAALSGMAMIQAGMADVVVAGGMEHMSGVPYALSGARWGYRLQDNTVEDALIHALHAGSHLLPLGEDAPVDLTTSPGKDLLGKPYIMGHTAEFVADKYGLTREEMDEVALRSHNNVQRANEQGDFDQEIVPVEVPRRKKDPIVFAKDEHFRPDLSMQDLAKLPPAFLPKTGKVTAGNASGINDGSAGMVIMSASRARELGLSPLATIKAVGKGACHPSVMGLSPVPAVQDLVGKSGYEIADFDLVELNEAFAAQYLGCERELGLNRERTNINGSGIGIGHPVGATGARIMVTLTHALRKSGKNLGLATLCGGGGVSMACALEING
ncbi:thiolase family protein [Desulfovermiculus halophilus]|uniref:thiolase family protein n=1 Tax=Desulfovermiculus halophilus TaxID=339722 RepID=UPI000489469B|nr:thiolase family protein [Desulfovermiculus halophilus]